MHPTSDQVGKTPFVPQMPDSKENKKVEKKSYQGAEKAAKLAEEVGVTAGEPTQTQDVTPTKKDILAKAANEPEAKKVKEESEATGSFLSGFISKIRNFFSFINIFAYFRRDKDQNYIKATPEKLSQAAEKLHDYLLDNANEVFSKTGVFRISVPEKKKIIQFNQVVRSPNTDLPEDVDTHLAAVVFKKVYADLNLFASDENLVKEFKQVAEQLSVMPAPSEGEVIQLLKNLKETLPIERQADLKNFIEVLAKASEYSAQSQMDVKNLAIVAGPNLCDANISDFSEAIAFSAKRQQVAAKFIEHYAEVFEV